MLFRSTIAPAKPREPAPTLRVVDQRSGRSITIRVPGLLALQLTGGADHSHSLTVSDATQPSELNAGEKITLGQALIASADTPHTSAAAREQRMLVRADALLRSGDISGARLVLERALEEGSSLAAFTLAETYDPTRLSLWRVRGIQGDREKAQRLYDRGIGLAKERRAATSKGAS